MSQEAGNSAYSWWVASHIRTKQSKWLEQSLQEMEENVSAIIKLISEDGDSFAKRAEMYYEKRPELLDFVEESYRIYRALAERYDHISTELQNANNTLASAFPERLQFAVNDDDDKYGSTQMQMPKRRTLHPNPKTNSSTLGDPKQLPTNNIKSIIALTATTNNASQPPPKKAGRRKGSKAIDALRSGLKKAQALGEIEKLQKSVLTNEEFMGSSYGKSSVVARYDKGIMELQEKVQPLQDEFTVRKTIEDNGASNLMFEAAAKSYNHGLTELRDKLPELSMTANQVRQRINIYNRNEHGEQQREKEAKILYQPNGRNKQVTSRSQEREIEVLEEREMKEQFPSKGDSSISVSGMVEKIDELAAKVSNLESVVSSQIAIIPRLREERLELQGHIQSLENDKANLIDGNNILSDNLKETKHKLKELQEIDHIQHTRNDNFERLAKESSSSSSRSSSSSSNNLELISQSQKLSDLNLDEEIGEKESKLNENAIMVENEPPFLAQQSEPNNLPRKSLQGEDLRVPLMGGDESCYIDVQQKELDTSNDIRMFPPVEVGIDVSIIQQGEDHSSCCKSGEMDDNGEDSLAELRELRNENAIKDEEIQSLQQKLDFLQQKLEDQYKNVKEPAKEDDTSTSQKDEYIIKLMHEVDETSTVSPAEAKLRASTDEILEQNLDFWMRLSCSLCEMDKFHSRVKNLQKDVAVMAEENETKSEVDARTIMYDDLKEIQSNLVVWSTKSMALKDELQCRFLQLCRVQQDITKALNDEAIGNEMQFTSLHAAKFQGEVLNMKQENVRVAEKLQASLDDVTNLQTQVEGIIDELNRRELGRTESSKGSGQLGWKNQAPIRSFISKLKLKRKQKDSIFSDVHPTFHIKYQPLTY